MRSMTQIFKHKQNNAQTESIEQKKCEKLRFYSFRL